MARFFPHLPTMTCDIGILSNFGILATLNLPSTVKRPDFFLTLLNVSICSGAIFLASVAQAISGGRSPVGDWYGEGRQRGERILSLTHYRTDGSFLTEFRECLPNWTGVHTESGHWSFAKDRMFETTELAKGVSVHFTALYETLSIDGHVWRSRIVGGDALQAFGGITFKRVLVTPDSQLPGCDRLS